MNLFGALERTHGLDFASDLLVDVELKLIAGPNPGAQCELLNWAENLFQSKPEHHLGRYGRIYGAI